MFPLKDDIPTRQTPVLTIALILANVVIFFLSIRNGGSIWSGPDPQTVVEYGVIPYEVTHPGDQCELVDQAGQVLCEGQSGVRGEADPQPATALTVFSSMFMHGGLLHIGGNMLFLWVFGNNVEDSMGRLRFLVFYLLGGVAAMALQTAVDPSSTVPAVGASGAVAAVLGGYLLIYPRARVLTLVFLFIFFTFIQIPAMFFLVIWFGQQLLFGYLDYVDPTGGGGGVAYFAHIGGFLFGLAAIKAFARYRNPNYGGPRYPVY
ncbi:MAG TPA: rhomboid family intramembrane serine protease [Solirubrobacteraceae bacterium]|nr:rhomboid family intramembrane serine protease [Solirubrobacteraceae bacterium]